MIFDQVIIIQKCLLFFRAESKRARGTETGGPLVGYVTPENVLIIVDAAGPGPRAVLKRYSVTIDGEYAQRFCDAAGNMSDGRVDYVGVHRHTGISLRPSPHDVYAMKIMAEFTYSPTKFPVSLIYRKWPEALVLYVWDGSGSLRRIPQKKISYVDSIHEITCVLSNGIGYHQIPQTSPE